MNKRFALGTVQFGLSYGIANEIGQVSINEAATILEVARDAGLDTLDTAISYGESEQRLGAIGVQHWRVVSKLPALPDTSIDLAEWVGDSVSSTLERLGLSKLHGLLLHRSAMLLESQGDTLYGALSVLRDQGKIGKIGVSIYDPQELDALPLRYKLDLVQAPFNVLDRRLAVSGWLDRLHAAGVEVHTRSAFLQGLLLMDASKRPAAFSRWQPLWDAWHRLLAERNLTALQACLGFVLSHPQIDRIVIGVDSVQQLHEILESVKAAVVVPSKDLMSDDLDLINPSRWRVH
jgi:aryl-alcohol dehydrogenase-like predicted oxidoreductase